MPRRAAHSSAHGAERERAGEREEDDDAEPSDFDPKAEKEKDRRRGTRRWTVRLGSYGPRVNASAPEPGFESVRLVDWAESLDSSPSLT